MDEAFKQLASSGPLGLAVCALGYVAWALYKRIDEIQEKRVADAKLYAENMAAAAGIIRDNTATIQRLIDASPRSTHD